MSTLFFEVIADKLIKGYVISDGSSFFLESFLSFLFYPFFYRAIFSLDIQKHMHTSILSPLFLSVFLFFLIVLFLF